MIKKENKQFKIVSVEEQNPFFDISKSRNGGGYHQPLITFTFNGKTGFIDDSSCGDFGERFSVIFGDKYYWLDTINGYEENSTFSKKDDMILARYLNEAGYPVVFIEELEELEMF